MNSDQDGINIVLIAGALIMLLLVGGIIGGVVWLYGRQSARRRSVADSSMIKLNK